MAVISEKLSNEAVNSEQQMLFARLGEVILASKQGRPTDMSIVDISSDIPRAITALLKPEHTDAITPLNVAKTLQQANTAEELPENENFLKQLHPAIKAILEVVQRHYPGTELSRKDFISHPFFQDKYLPNQESLFGRYIKRVVKTGSLIHNGERGSASKYIVSNGLVDVDDDTSHYEFLASPSTQRLVKDTAKFFKYIQENDSRSPYLKLVKEDVDELDGIIFYLLKKCTDSAKTSTGILGMIEERSSLDKIDETKLLSDIEASMERIVFFYLGLRISDPHRAKKMSLYLEDGTTPSMVLR